ncbi:MAG TPA: GNAT family N-acetyltransferase [Ktedonobacterales bacterium]|jgi:diamine N-acetyltransferase|nr:GNAT family N-acetyltransferase [Ktedonobacterales bacterium]
MTITLQEITRENWLQCARLKVAPEQERFVASNGVSMAQSKYEPEYIPLAVYDGDEMVGFVMYGLEKTEGKYWIMRVMVDHRYQGKGYGRAAMQLLLDRIHAIPDCDEVAISYEPENEVARRLYASLGFRETGEIIEEETVARLSLKP